MQGLVDYANPKLVFHQMTLSPFGKNYGIAEQFTLISVEGTPIKIWCFVTFVSEFKFGLKMALAICDADRVKNLDPQ